MNATDAPAKILVVDDVPTNIQVVSNILREEYHVFFAVSGASALDLAVREMPDLILLDVVMPEMDGYEVCERLKADPITEEIPVIFVTGQEEEEDETRGLDAGAIDYLTKPVSPAILRARVRNHLELKRRGDILKGLSHLDGLTGIANRRRFDEMLEREWRRCRRNAKPLSLLMMDVDFFKRYNDHYGHIAGDDCLKAVAVALCSVVKRPGDLVARYGGEEFVALLPETVAPGALEVAEAINHAINDLDIPHAESEASGHVTLSIGCATLVPGGNKVPLELVEAADGRLYTAKEEGRNCVRGVTL